MQHPVAVSSGRKAIMANSVRTVAGHPCPCGMPSAGETMAACCRGQIERIRAGKYGLTSARAAPSGRSEKFLGGALLRAGSRELFSLCPITIRADKASPLLPNLLADKATIRLRPDGITGALK